MTFLEMVNRCLKRAGNQKQIASVASPTRPAEFFIGELNLVLGRQVGAMPFEFLYEEGEIQLLEDEGPTTTGLADGDSTIVVLTTVMADPGHVGALVRFAGENRIYRIASVTNTTTFVLDTPYRGTSSDKVLTIVQPRYALPANFDRPLALSGYVTAPWRMEGKDPEEFFRSWMQASDPIAVAQPEIYTTFGHDESAGVYSQYLWVYPMPGINDVLPIRYYRAAAEMTVDGDIPTIPERYHMAPVYGALGRWYSFREPDFAKAGHYQKRANEVLAAAIVNHPRSAERPSANPRNNRGHFAQ